MYVRSLHTTKACKFVFLLRNNRCVIATVCVWVLICFFALHACTLPARDLRWKEPTENVSPSLSLSSLQGLSVVCIFLSSSSSLTSPPTSLLSSPPPALIFPLICRCLCHKEQILSLVIACLLATTPVAVIALVWEREGELCPLASTAPTLPPPLLRV